MSQWDLQETCQLPCTKTRTPRLLTTFGRPVVPLVCKTSATSLSSAVLIFTVVGGTKEALPLPIQAQTLSFSHHSSTTTAPHTLAARIASPPCCLAPLGTRSHFTFKSDKLNSNSSCLLVGRVQRSADGTLKCCC